MVHSVSVWASCLPDVSCCLLTDGKRAAPGVVVCLRSFKASSKLQICPNQISRIKMFPATVNID